MPESTAATIARMEARLEGLERLIDARLVAIEQAVGAGDREGQQSLATLDYRVRQLEEAAKTEREARRALRAMAISALVFSPVAAIVTAMVTASMGGG